MPGLRRDFGRAPQNATRHHGSTARGSPLDRAAVSLPDVAQPSTSTSMPRQQVGDRAHHLRGSMRYGRTRPGPQGARALTRRRSGCRHRDGMKSRAISSSCPSAGDHLHMANSSFAALAAMTRVCPRLARFGSGVASWTTDRSTPRTAVPGRKGTFANRVRGFLP